MINYLDVAV